MGSFFSQEAPSLEAQAASETESLKGSWTKVAKSPTPARSKRDGRSYKEVVQAGPEKDSMSKLSQSGVAWEFCKTSENEKVSLQEHLP